jgi:Xaa-Pro aminopeptidase
MKDGELVRMDVGCALGHYEGDVGRTIPVSGKFNADQRETLDLLVRAYRAGLAAMKGGVPLQTVMERARSEVERSKETLSSDYARRAAVTIIAAPLPATWHIHGVGLDGGETGTDTLEAGSVIAFEPMFSVDDDAYYMTSGLPYTAAEIEAAMSLEN